MQANNTAPRHVVIGVTAHVDAGKTTLCEALLYHAGQLRKLGRVDHGSTAMDSHLLERERGITIFMSQAELPLGQLQATLLDTPGHVDFSAETERTLSVLDYAILVISGTDGVQAHTRTLWRLLDAYRVPTVLFITKMDFCRFSRQELLAQLRYELGEGCVDFSDEARPERMEALATCREDALEAYLETGEVPDDLSRQLIAQRLVFPCWFGSGLKLEGIDDFMAGLERYIQPPTYPDAFAARVFKISHDPQGKRLTHLKVTGGVLRVRDSIPCGGLTEKAAQLRIYTGGRFRTVDEVPAGGICAVQGLTQTCGGQGLGMEARANAPVLEPVLRYRLLLPADCDSRVLLPQLKQLEEEDPQLRFSWDERLGEIHVALMGRVQAEILKSLVSERFGVDIELDRGRVLYKETIDAPVEGVGHYEPLRHYAEVHLLLEPLPQGSGLVLDSRCPEDQLDRNWQRLILTHLGEKQHLGVLTGSPITDMKLTLMSGRAHIKHTEGGDFRQATYRAVRQGLMQAQCRLLEPYYAFRLELPPEQLGRAINDIRLRSGSFDTPEETGMLTLLRGKVPVTEFDSYAQELAAYTGGRGRLSLELAGYGPCHNPEAVIAAADYAPEADLDNSPDSVFCAHGGGFNVKWNKVPEYMHLPSCLEKPRQEPVRHRSLRLDDAELEAIMAREFGPVSRPLYRAPQRPETPPEPQLRPIGNRYYVVDGYNVIYDWDELRALAEQDLSAARERLMDTLCGYAAFTHCQVVLVFDGYKVPGNQGEKFDHRGIHVVYTRERETGDMYIERFLQQVGRNDQVRVVTSDGLIQLAAVRTGVLRMSSAEFGRQVDEVAGQIAELLARIQPGGATIGQLTGYDKA